MAGRFVCQLMAGTHPTGSNRERLCDRHTTFRRFGHLAPQMWLRFVTCLCGQSAVISSDQSNSLASMPYRETSQRGGAGRAESIKMVQGRTEMKVAMTTLTLIAAMSVRAYAFGGGYNAVAAYGACQEDALRGVHYALEGDCPNWEAWRTSHMQVQTLPHRHIHPTSRRKAPPHRGIG